MPKTGKKNKAEKPTDRANLSQNLDQRVKVQDDTNGRHGISPK